MTTHLRSEVDALRAKLAAAEQELDAWRSYDRDKGDTVSGDATIVDDVVKVWTFRKAYPSVRTNVAARMAMALYATPHPLTVERLDELVPMSWARNGGERRDLRAYFGTLACYLRKAMGRESIVTINSYGYALSPMGREKLAAVWGDDV